MAIHPQRPQTIGGVLDTAIQLYKTSVFKVWPMTLLLAIVSSLPSVYALAIGLHRVDSGSLSTVYWVIYVITMVLVMGIVAGLYIAEHSIGMGEPIGGAAALKRAMGRILPLVLMTILFMIALVIGSVLLIVPGLILMVSLMLGTNLLVLEGKGAIESLKGSHALVWGNWWRTTAILTIGFIIVAIVYMLFAFVAGLAMTLAGSEDFVLMAMVVAVVVGVLASLFMTPFYTALLIAVYWDLKLRKEGGDLAARVGALNPA